ncbi:MAG: hypothetical protein DMG65_09155 [Candidatus Angelobacter sp. Gp1-AA117]|nr:MAG: hypothetical protein DMG65_09155 [Candidatus Angelobacter sp. Gp1-AA117]
MSLASIKHIDCPKGSEELECSECRASLEFSYETAVEIKEVIFIDLPKTKLKKPYDELSREVLERKDASATKKNCPVCRKVVPVAVIEFADLPKGNDIVNCPTCNADLEVYYKASFQVTEIEVTGVAGDGNFACPECETEMELDWQEIETKEGEIEYECDECGAELEVSWSDWGAELGAELAGEGSRSTGRPGNQRSRNSGGGNVISCGRCENDVSVDDDGDEIKCETCGATLEISRSSSGTIEDVETHAPDLELACPECDDDFTIDGNDIEEVSGHIEYKCEGCDSELGISWSKWGEDTEVDVIEPGEEEDEEDEDDDDV